MGTRLFHAIVIAGASLGAGSILACGGADEGDLWTQPSTAAVPEAVDTEVDAATGQPPVTSEPMHSVYPRPVPIDVDAWPPTKM